MEPMEYPTRETPQQLGSAERTNCFYYNCTLAIWASMMQALWKKSAPLVRNHALYRLVLAPVRLSRVRPPPERPINAFNGNFEYFLQTSTGRCLSTD
jgi:hypothetical protein